LNISIDKQDVRLFLQSYLGYLDATKMSRFYLALIEKSASLHELDENLERTITDEKLDDRHAEVLRKLHIKMKSSGS